MSPLAFLLLLVPLLVHTCPQYLQSVCLCEELHNGISLNCSDSDGVHTVQLLRANQANVGLIQKLILHNSRLTSLPAGFFSGLYIKKLDLSHNQLTAVDANAFLGMNNVLQELFMHHNHLTELPASALISLTQLLKLDLSNNSIADLQSQHALPPLPKLYDVNLADNRICQVHKSAFDQVKASIQTVNLGRNCLGAVPASAIRGFKRLMALHLHGNNITSLDALSFMNLPVMNLLNLATNRIRDIHRQAFLNVPNLRYLYLTSNRIQQVLPHQFSSFSQLEMLDLTSNNLVNIAGATFSELHNLRQLYLGENRIANIQPDAFTNSSIVILVLNSNRLTHLEEGMFEGLDKLQQISLKDNQIRTVDRNIFYSNPSLVMIDLSENQLIDIPSGAFLSQTNIFLVDLSRNKLIRTPYAAFSRRVKTVLLQENPLVCTERVHMLQEGVGVYVPNSKDSICGPRSHLGNVTLSPDEQEVSKMAEEEFFTPTQLGTEHSSSTFVQDAPSDPGTLGTVIKPLSALTSQESAAKGSTQSRTSNSNNNGNPVVTVHPLNASQEGSPLQRPPPRIQIAPIASRTRGNFGFVSKTTTRTATATDNTTPQPKDGFGTNTTQKHNSHDPFSVDNPDVIHPFPVPFLNRPPKIYPAFMVTTTPNTLPPSIVIADDHEKNQSTADVLEKDSKMDKVELEARTAIPKKAHEIADAVSYEVNPNKRLERMAAPSLIIILCLSTVAIVMGTVFVGLCIAKHRRMSRFGSSSASSAAAMRTNAYVTAQAAHMNMIYGSVNRNRSGPSSMGRPDDPHSWAYAHGAYGSPYYK